MKTLNLQLSRRLQEIYGDDAPGSHLYYDPNGILTTHSQGSSHPGYKDGDISTSDIVPYLPSYTFQEIDFKLLGEKAKYNWSEFVCGLCGADSMKCCPCPQLQDGGVPIVLETWLYHAQRLNEIRLVENWEEMEEALGVLLK